MQSALDNARLVVSADAPPMSGEALEALLRAYNAVMATIKRFGRRYHEAALEKMIYLPALTEEALRDRDRAQSWFRELENRLNSDETGSHYQVKLQEDAEHGAWEGRLLVTTHGVTQAYRFGTEFFISAEYASIVDLGRQLEDLIGEGAYVQRGERRCDIASFKQAVDWLMQEGRRGHDTQRYKGLGEMNPQQLWETTMDPESRRLMQVKIEDAVAADELFTTLMGDHVEPRRDFIEHNALSVSNLDI